MLEKVNLLGCWYQLCTHGLGMQPSQGDFWLAAGAPISQQLRQLRQGVDIVVGTPGRVQDIQERGELSLAHVSRALLCL